MAHYICVLYILTRMEAKYSQTKLESLVMVFDIACFKIYLAGRPFTLQTDHLPILGLFCKAIDPQQWIIQLQQCIIQLQQYP